MITKEQERKAVEKIEKIIAELGTDSYVEAAFRGCADLARQNIDNDFMESMQDKYFEAENKRNEEIIKKTRAVKEAEEAHQDAIMYEDKYEELVKEYENYKQRADEDFQRMKEQRDEAVDEAGNLYDKLHERDRRIEEQAQEIIELKAKLYDLMVAK